MKANVDSRWRILVETMNYQTNTTNSYKMIYSALFLSEKEQSKLKAMFPPVHPNVFYHHSTIAFKPTDTSNIEIGKTYKINITGRLTTDKVDVLLVENIKSLNKHPHITLSTAEGVKPFASNEEIANNLDKIQKLNEIIEVTEGVE